MSKPNMSHWQIAGAIGTGMAALSFTGCESLIQKEEVQKKNVLFIAIDDFTPKHWGCSGGTVVQTPHVDALAADGLLFNRAYCPSPACVPSRQSVTRGLLPSTSGVFGNFTPIEIKRGWCKTPEQTTLYSHFQANGYVTASAGKVDHGLHKDHIDYRLDDTITFPNRDEEIAAYIKPEQKAFKAGIVHFRGKDMPLQILYGPSGMKEEHEWDYINASRGIRFLNQKHEKPFFLALGLTSTHTAYSVPKKYHEMYPIDEMVVPFVPENDRDDMITDYDKIGPYPFRDAPEEVSKEMISAHFACMSFIDDQIGRVIQTLKETGQYENTVIVLWTDHGNMIGEHGIWSKGPLLEDAVSSGLIFKAPGIPGGTVCERPVESVDIFATLSDVCGLGVPENLDSVSMKTLLENPKAEWKKGAMVTSMDVHEDNSISGSSRLLITEDFSFTKQYIDIPYAKAGDMELYDLRTDPECFNNVAHDKEYAGVLNELEQLLDSRYKPYAGASE